MFQLKNNNNKIFILKQGKYYEPLCQVKSKNKKNIIYDNDMKTHSDKIINNRLNNLLNKYCTKDKKKKEIYKNIKKLIRKTKGTEYEPELACLNSLNHILLTI